MLPDRAFMVTFFIIITIIIFLNRLKDFIAKKKAQRATQDSQRQRLAPSGLH